MEILQDGVIAFFTAVGLASVVWVLAGAFLGAGRPMIPGLALVLPLRREALAMECGNCAASSGRCRDRSSSWQTAG